MQCKGNHATFFNLTLRSYSDGLEFNLIVSITEVIVVEIYSIVIVDSKVSYCETLVAVSAEYT